MTEPTPALSPIAIIRQSLKQLFQNFRTVIGIGLIFNTWYYLLLAVMFAVDHHRIEQGLSQGISYGESPSLDALVYAIALSMVAGLILNPLGFAATAFAIDDSYQGHPTSLRSCLSRTFKRSRALASAVSRLALQLFFAFICFILPGIYLWVKYCLTYQVVAIENSNGGEALDRSEELTKGKMLIAFATIMVPLLLGSLMGFLEDTTKMGVVYVIVSTITGTFVSIFSFVTNAVLYQTYSKIDDLTRESSEGVVDAEK